MTKIIICCISTFKNWLDYKLIRSSHYNSHCAHHAGHLTNHPNFFYFIYFQWQIFPSKICKKVSPRICPRICASLREGKTFSDLIFSALV